MTPAEAIGRRIAAARKEVEMSQPELGRALAPFFGGKGWARQSVSAAENGNRAFKATDLLALAKVLHQPIGWFFAPPGAIDDVVRFPGGARSSPGISWRSHTDSTRSSLSTP